MGTITVATVSDGFWMPDPSAFDSSSHYLRVGRNSSGQYTHSYMRWTGITIPAGAVITRAYISVHYARFSAGAPHGDIFFNDVATPSSPSSEPDADAKVKTTNSVEWTFTETTGWLESPDITPIIKELIASYGPYTSGSMMALLRYHGTSYPNVFLMDSLNEDPNYAPMLTIEWAGGSGQVRIIGMAM